MINGWIGSFFHDRQQAVVVDGTRSDYVKVRSGVPQGSVLGPTLFLIYINELPNLVQSSCKLFADDTKLFKSISTNDDCKTLQADLDTLSDWSSKWLLKFNTEKCKIELKENLIF